MLYITVHICVHVYTCMYMYMVIALSIHECSIVQEAAITGALVQVAAIISAVASLIE